MEAGKLSHRIEFLSPTYGNNFGEVTPSFSSAGSVWAFVKVEQGREALESARLNASQQVRVCVRYRSDVGTDWRFIWEGKTFGIVAVDPSLRREKGELWITGKAVGV
jgi:SPP1 family predicted phage head-tail adaptor